MRWGGFCFAKGRRANNLRRAQAGDLAYPDALRGKPVVESYPDETVLERHFLRGSPHRLNPIFGTCGRA